MVYRNHKKSEEKEKKICVDCGTTKTPCWRSGPTGSKTLCNACGIRSRKKIEDIAKIQSKKLSAISSTKRTCSTTTAKTTSSKFGQGRATRRDQRLVSLGREVAMERSTVVMRLLGRRKLSEEEQAALLLMALSYGSFCA